MKQRLVQLDPQWLAVLNGEFEREYMRDLSRFLRAEKAVGKTIYPAGESIFAAMNTTPLEKVEVVILGQDPYHGSGQANGLSFSVPTGTPIPPSLKNIYKEIVSEFAGPVPTHGNLLDWARQGVLLLNSVLTVEKAKAASHRGRGWERFTDKIVEIVSTRRNNIVFLLWGAYAHRKGQSIDRSRHLVLQAPHPSPLSAHRGFLGCGHFSQANNYLTSVGKAPINWQIQ